MGAIEQCVYASEITETGRKCTLYFDNGVTLDVTNRIEEEVLTELGHYGWILVSIKQEGTKRSLFFDRLKNKQNQKVTIFNL